MALVILVVVAWAIGVLIRLTGVGGILLGPALIVLGGMGANEASGTALCCVVPAGVASAVQHRKAARQVGSVERRLVLGLAIGAAAGAFLNGAVPPAAATIALAGLAGTSGLRMLFGQPAAQSAERASLRAGAGVAIGSIAGGASGLTGTSGPVVLVPILVAARIPVQKAVAAGQAAQGVVAPVGAAVYLSTVTLDYHLLAGLSVALVLGQLLGQAAAPRLPASSLRTLVAVTLLGTAALLLLRPLTTH